MAWPGQENLSQFICVDLEHCGEPLILDDSPLGKRWPVGIHFEVAFFLYATYQALD